MRYKIQNTSMYNVHIESIWRYRFIDVWRKKLDTTVSFTSFYCQTVVVNGIAFISFSYSKNISTLLWILLSPIFLLSLIFIVWTIFRLPTCSWAIEYSTFYSVNVAIFVNNNLMLFWHPVHLQTIIIQNYHCQNQIT